MSDTVLWGAVVGAVAGAMSSKQRKFVWFAAAFIFGIGIGSAWQQGKSHSEMDKVKVTQAEDVKRGIELSRIEQLKKPNQVEKSVEDHPEFGMAYAAARSTLDWVEQDDAGREIEVEQLLKQIREKEPEQRSSLDTRWTGKNIIQLFNENPQAISMFRKLMDKNEKDLQALKAPEPMRLITVLLAAAKKAGYESAPDALIELESLEKLFVVLFVEDFLAPNLPHMPE